MVSKAAQRASTAINEMKAFGFPKDKAKLVLRSLLQSFGSWELIERDNYSVLVDAILSYEEDQGFIKKTNEVADDEDLQKKEEYVSDGTALFRRRSRSQDGSEASLAFHSQETSEQNVAKKSKSNMPNSVGDTSQQALIKNSGTGREDAFPFERSKGKEVVDSPMLPASQNFVCFKEPKLEPGNDGNWTGNVHAQLSEAECSTFESPIAVILPPLPYSGAAGDMGVARTDSSVVEHMMTSANKNLQHSRPSDEVINESKENPSEMADGNDTSPGFSKSSMKHIEIASSSKGEVKLSLSFNDMNSGNSFLDMESVLRKVEDKCLKSYKIIQPNLSLVNLMKELCQTMSELSELAEPVSHVNFTPMFNSLKHSMSPNVFSCASASKDTRILNNGSLSLVPDPHHGPGLGHNRPHHDASDICKGEERVKISITNDFSHERHPVSFFYVPQNIVYQNGHVDFSLARIGDQDCCSDCFGDCLSASRPCTCARETGGEYAYTSDGLIKKEFLDDCISRFHNKKQYCVYCKVCPLGRLKNDTTPGPCKGHLVRKFIKECWVKCGCNRQCGNRVVQRAITCNLQVFYTSEGKGWGLRTLNELPRGAFVCEYVGEVLTNTELHERAIKTTGNAKHTCPVLLDADWGGERILKDEDALWLDATFYGNVARFINHRCFDSNLIEIPVQIETPNRNYYHLAFFTSRKIEPFEELTWDYGINFNEHSHPVKAFQCQCGSRYCRNMRKRSRRGSSASVPT